MIPKKRIINSKTSINDNKLNKPGMTKSARLIINTSHINSNNISNRLPRNLLKKSNSVDKNYQKTTKFNKSNKNNKSSKVYNINIQRQNSQGVLYSLKNYINDTQFTHANQKYCRQNSQILNETKTPIIFELLNNKLKNKRKHLETYNNNSNKDNNYNKPNASLSLAQRKKNLSQGNLDCLNFDEYYKYNIFSSSRNQKMEKKIIKGNHQSQKGNYDRYDRNKCVIERKMYGGERRNKKNDGKKNAEDKTMPGNCERIYNENLFNKIKLNINKELNLNSRKMQEKNITNSHNHVNININNPNNKKNINNNINDNNSSHKLLIKSKTNNILNTSLEDLTENNNIESVNSFNNNNSNNNKEIKLIFPSFNKCDINNDLSQESTNQIGNTFSNKITINSNIGYRKEKIISSFLDGPEDIHCKFVELHKQRKMFYENFCNKLEEDGNSLDNNKANVNDFEISEYSEYFENYNESVPFI